MVRTIGILAYFAFSFFGVTYAVVADFNLWDKIERFGLPTVLLIGVLYFANKQNEKRMAEQREFWADNNRYFRTLIQETKAGNLCRYKDN